MLLNGTVSNVKPASRQDGVSSERRKIVSGELHYGLFTSGAYEAAITLISTFTFLGNPLTATVSLAGKLSEK